MKKSQIDITTGIIIMVIIILLFILLLAGLGSGGSGLLDNLGNVFGNLT